MRRKTVFLLFMALMLAACQETMDQRCAREAREYTEKHCPAMVAKGVTIDSLTFDAPSRTLIYSYTIEGPSDDAELLAKTDYRDVLLKELRNSTSMKSYKEAGYNFRYVYWSAKNKGTRLIEVTFQEKDYR
jgi:ADP-ribose pyrophosphatase YjhB (NUDIX family)